MKKYPEVAAQFVFHEEFKENVADLTFNELIFLNLFEKLASENRKEECLAVYHRIVSEKEKRLPEGFYVKASHLFPESLSKIAIDMTEDGHSIDLLEFCTSSSDKEMQCQG